MIRALLDGFASLPGWNVSLLLLLAKATIILIAALGITLTMQRASATARHLVWLVTLGSLLLIPALTAWAPLRIAVLPAGEARAAATMSETSRSLTSFGTTNEVRATREDAAAPSTQSVASLSASVEGMNPLTMLLAIWGAVVAGIIATLAWAGMNVRRIVRRARPLDSPDWVNPLFEIADRLSLEDAPRLLQSDEAKMPFACGVFTPTIVLPAESESWSLDRRRAVLLHELAHVRRRDLLGHTLGRLTCAVYWFHPLVWTAARRLRSESERACDDLALSCGTRATDYAEHLLDIVTSVRGDTTPLVALAMARRKEFEGRMLAILDPDLRRSTPSRRQSAALIAALALISLTVGAASPVARTADAAVVAGAPAPQPSAAPVAKPASAFADVRVSQPMQSRRQDRESRTDTATSVSVSVSRSISASASASMGNLDGSTEHAARALAEAGINLGLKAAATALQNFALGKDDKGPRGQKSVRADERPALLAKVLRTDTSATLRKIAAWGLHEYADVPVAAEALANAVRRDAEPKVREMAAWSLGNGDDNETVTTGALVVALKGDSNERVRMTSAWALGNRGDRAATDALAAALGDASSSVRTRAAWALGNVEPREAPRALIDLLKDKEPRVRELAAWALYQIEDESSAGALEAALKVEQDKGLQLSYIRALAAMGEKSVDAIKGLLDSSDPNVRSMAVRALAGGHASGPWPMPWPEPRPYP